MLTYVSLFSSAGVGCYGFKQQGFKCIATNEYLKKRIKIQEVNRKCELKSGYITGDLSQQGIQDQIYKELKNNNINTNKILLFACFIKKLSLLFIVFYTFEFGKIYLCRTFEFVVPLLAEPPYQRVFKKLIYR